MEQDHNFPYDFTVRQFNYQGIEYKVVLTPDLSPDDEGLDFTGNWLGILISERRGTMTFELEADTHLRWRTTNKLIDPGMVDELDGIIRKIRQIQ